MGMTRDDVQDELLMLNTIMDVQGLKIDVAQSKELAYHKKHIQVLWRHLQNIEKVLSVSDGQVIVKTGDASITLKKDGTVNIKGRDINVEGWGKINMKASSELVLKGSKILQN